MKIYPNLYVYRYTLKKCLMHCFNRFNLLHYRYFEISYRYIEPSIICLPGCQLHSRNTEKLSEQLERMHGQKLLQPTRADTTCEIGALAAQVMRSYCTECPCSIYLSKRGTNGPSTTCASLAPETCAVTAPVWLSLRPRAQK